MSDRLDAVLETAAPLLRRVDDVLAAAGAPAEHEVWRALRRVRLLPWDAVQAVAALRPAELAEAARELRADARECAGFADGVPGPGEWSGAAADAYDAARKRAADRLGGTDGSLDERLRATADLAESLVNWIAGARTGLARTLADVLTSNEALALSPHTYGSTVDPSATGEAVSAARVATTVLDAVAAIYDDAMDLVSATDSLTTVDWTGPGLSNVDHGRW